MDYKNYLCKDIAKKMKCLFKIVFVISGMLFCNLAHSAILNDSTVVVLANWSKNECHKLSYSQNQYKICGKDTIKDKSIRRNFSIEVDDSTQHLYSLRFERLSEASLNDSIPLDEFPLRLMTNRNGALIKVLNWDAYLAWRQNDVELTSKHLFPYVSILSYNGKKLKLNHPYTGSQLLAGSKFGYVDSIVSETKMFATQDFEKSGEYELVTIKTITTYHLEKDNSPIPVEDKFVQVVDCNNGWPIATYFDRRTSQFDGILVESWSVKLIE